MFEILVSKANNNAHIRRLGRGCTTAFVLQVDNEQFHLSVDRGQITSVSQGPFQMRGSSFVISAAKDTWTEFMRPIPRPGFHDIFAMSATGNARIEGDINILLGHLAYFKAVLDLLRKV